MSMNDPDAPDPTYRLKREDLRAGDEMPCEPRQILHTRHEASVSRPASRFLTVWYWDREETQEASQQSPKVGIE